MIGKFSADYCKNHILYQVYLKAHKELTELNINPTTPIQKPLHLWKSYIEEMYEEAFVSESISSLTYTFAYDQNTSEEFSDFMDCIQENLQSVDYPVYVITDFHFSMLYDNLEIFNSEEKAYWISRMKNLFHSLSLINVMTYEDFFDSYITNHFVGFGQLTYEIRKRMSYVYVILGDVDIEFTEDDNIIQLFPSIVDFAKGYIAFYKDLAKEVNERKVGIHIA